MRAMAARTSIASVRGVGSQVRSYRGTISYIHQTRNWTSFSCFSLCNCNEWMPA